MRYNCNFCSITLACFHVVAVQMFGGETSHWLAVKAAQYGVMPRVWRPETSPCLVGIII